jgi:carbon starvation protein
MNPGGMPCQTVLYFDDALPNRSISILLWTGVVALGAFAFAGIALNRNEPVSAAWLVTAAICVYLIAYRFYGRFIAQKVLKLDPTRMTPAERHNDGLDYVPTNKYVVFGHHFAAIAGAGPLVGPVLAAQMGYLPGTLWILVVNCEDAHRKSEVGKRLVNLLWRCALFQQEMGLS